MLRVPVLMLLSLLAGVLCAGAQPRAGHDASLDTKPIMARGCLSSTRGNYILRHGDKVFTLVGDGAKLQSRVGQTIEITGQPIPADPASTAAAEGNSSGAAPRQNATSLKVQDLTIVSDHCDPSSTTGAATGANTVAAPGVGGAPADPPPQRNLPNSATILPLVGMVGLGSLAASLIMRR